MAVESVGWSGVIQSLIAAGSGLLGVLVGSFMTALNAKRERRSVRIKAQLQEFYSPMLGVRSEIKAKSEVRVKIISIAGQSFGEDLESGARRNLEPGMSAKYKALNSYNETQLRESLIPLYREMLEHFTHHMYLAEPSTRIHYYALCEFVEIWNRSLDESLPDTVAQKLLHDEGTIKPLYDDLKFHFDRLVRESEK